MVDRDIRHLTLWGHWLKYVFLHIRLVLPIRKEQQEVQTQKGAQA